MQRGGSNPRRPTPARVSSRALRGPHGPGSLNFLLRKEEELLPALRARAAPWMVSSTCLQGVCEDIGGEGLRMLLVMTSCSQQFVTWRGAPAWVRRAYDGEEQFGSGKQRGCHRK